MVMMMDMAQHRRFFAEEVQVTANIRTPALVEALARVPREKFLAPGPWLIRSEADFGGPPRQTPDADPRHVYHNIAIVIDPARQLYNGVPGLVGCCIDALALRPGSRVLHVGCGTGYFSALIAECVGETGSLVAIDVDEQLASMARRNLANYPWVEVRHGDGTAGERDSFDAILVNAGTTHPHESWLAALTSGGRLLVPLTFTTPAMGPIGKGVMTLITRTEPEWTARLVTMTAIYSAIGLRDAALNDQLLKAFTTRGPIPAFKRMRRDAHEPAASCWLHGDAFCLSA